MPTGVRINKHLSETGYCSRREADRLIAAGKVFLNDKRAELGDKVFSGDDVRVEGRDKKQAPVYTYVMLNKPAGVNALNLTDYGDGVLPVGHLDLEVEGLILLTNDDTLARRLLLPRYQFDREYVVEVDRALSPSHIGQLQNGVKLNDGITLPAQVRKMDRTRFAIVLNEHHHRQIERMCEAVGLNVVVLKRTRILSLKMASTYPAGQWRNLTELEVQQLKKAVGHEKKQTNFKLHQR